jgi:hypothetical protein
MVLAHDRSLDHYGTEDTNTAVLAADIGRYPAGMTVQAVLEDFVARLAFIESVGCDTRLFAFTERAVIRTAAAPSFTANAVIRDPSQEVTLDAVIKKAQLPTLTANAIFIEDVVC